MSPSDKSTRALTPYNLEKLEPVIEPILRAARIPGAALAVVADGKTLYTKGFGYRDLKARKPLTTDTLYPIASTTKAINGLLLGMLVEEGRLEWDAPVQRYLPHFQLQDAAVSSRVTVRDLITMRTGLPRHDWVWATSKTLTREDLVSRLRFLEPAADFRQRYQYNNITATLAGHIAEVITGKTWQNLVRNRILGPLGMRHTAFELPTHGNFTRSYYESTRRKLLLTPRFPSEVTAPSGGQIHSTVTDMARWAAFNLNGGKLNDSRLVSPKILAELHAPNVVIGERSLTSQSPEGAYAIGWLVDYYNGHKRISHGGYLHDVSSSVMFFPNAGIGMVSFINFGCPGLADTINQYAFDTLMGLKPAQTWQEKLALYEKKIKENAARLASVTRSPQTRPSHPPPSHAGKYQHPGYGDIQIRSRGRTLYMQLRQLTLRLKHWHYDAWIVDEKDRFAIHAPHPFDPSSPLQFHLDARGDIAGFSLKLEPEVAPIRFDRV